ncbi:MAG: ribonuclease R, partial [Cellulosilyticaceae bacterium]
MQEQDRSNQELREQRKKKIMELINNPDYQPMKIKELIIILNVANEDRPIFEELIGSLIKEGKLLRNKRGKFITPQVLNMVTGTYQG